MSNPLSPDHRCRIDDLAYTTVSKWFDDHRGRVPIQAPWALDRYIKAYGCTFAEAWTALTAPDGPIILIEEPGDKRRRR
jgi:hypothetical protein